MAVEAADTERMLGMLEQIKHDVAQLEILLASLRPMPQPRPHEDIFAEMAGVTANAPNATDSREDIYTRMPGE